MGLVGSHCMPPVRSHWPDQSGYLVSSCARAAAIVVTITVASTTAPIELRTGMVVLPFGDGRGDGIYCETRIGCPSLSLVLLTDQEPPGAPLRNGSILSFSSLPGLSVLLDHPSRTNALGAAPSRLQSWVLPSCCLTARMMNECGLVNLNSCTTPSSSIGFSWSNIANE